VLKVLESQKVPINMIVGTSVGSFVGSLYAYGYDAYALQKIALSLERGDVAELTLPDNGFFRGDACGTTSIPPLRNTPLEKLRIPFYAVATNIKTGGETVFATGNTGHGRAGELRRAWRLPAGAISGNTYVDGGVVNPVAVEVARRYGGRCGDCRRYHLRIDNTVPSVPWRPS